MNVAPTYLHTKYKGDDQKRVHPYGFGPKKMICRIFNSARHTLTDVCSFLALNLEVYPIFLFVLNCTLFCH